MDDKQKEQSTVNGFIFGSKHDVEKAEQELTAVKYIDKKLEGKSAETILSVYNASIEKKMFRTPIGYSFLHDLQKRMLKMGVKKENIVGIPLYQVFEGTKEEERPPRVVQVVKQDKGLRRQNAILTLAVFILVVMIIVMFAMSMLGESPTILNYRRTVENEYAEWQQELTDKDNQLKEKERELIQRELELENSKQDVDTDEAPGYED